MNCLEYVLDMTMHNAEEVDSTVDSILETFNLKNYKKDLWGDVKCNIKEMEVRFVDINTFFNEAFSNIKYFLMDKYPFLKSKNIDYNINGEDDTNFYIVTKEKEYVSYNDIEDWEKFYQEHFEVIRDYVEISGILVSNSMSEKFSQDNLKKIITMIKFINSIFYFKEMLDAGMEIRKQDGLYSIYKNKEKEYVFTIGSNESNNLYKVSAKEFNEFRTKVQNIFYQK